MEVPIVRKKRIQYGGDEKRVLGWWCGDKNF